MLNPAVFISQPLLFKGKLNIYPPSVREVITNPNFNIFYRILTITEYDIKKEIGGKIPEGEELPSSFDYLLLNSQYVEGFSFVLQGALDFFCKTDVVFQYEEKQIILRDEVNIILVLSNENFFDFQNAIRMMVGDKPLSPPEPIDPDEDPRVRRIKEKARERDRIKARQGNKNGISLTTCLVAICCMGIGITPLNIGEMSYASIGAIMKMMQDKEKYDIDIRSLLAGADSKKIKPKYWIRNPDKE